MTGGTQAASHDGWAACRRPRFAPSHPLHTVDTGQAVCTGLSHSQHLLTSAHVCSDTPNGVSVLVQYRYSRLVLIIFRVCRAVTLQILKHAAIKKVLAFLIRIGVSKFGENARVCVCVCVCA